MNGWVLGAFSVLFRATADLHAVKTSETLYLKIRKSHCGDTLLPPVTLQHLRALTDCTGILQHAKYIVPNRFEGYCTDDNARALLVAAKHYDLFRDGSSLDLLKIYLAFTFHAQNEAGTLRNFMSYQRDFLDTVGADEVLGRTLWSCGYICSSAHIPKDIREVARVIFEKGVQHATCDLYIRGVAYSLLGLYYMKDAFHDARQNMQTLALRMLQNYEDARALDWEWFEAFMSYSNARLPQAMFRAFDVLGDPRMLACAESTLAFLWQEVVTSKGAINVIGNDGWYIQNKHRALGDEQAIDVGALVEAFLDAYRVTGKTEYYDNALRSFSWFTGNNLLRSPIYDDTTGGCRDGLSLEEGVNQNQGAESTVCYLLCRLAFEEVGKPR